jgi:Xaa-Pro dipeptidase
MKKIDRAKNLLKEQNIDGWLLYDFRRSNALACRFLDIPQEQLLSRRFYYWIPKEGEPVKLVSSVENPLAHLPGKTVVFRSWEELEERLKDLLSSSQTVAMEYSPFGAVPEVSRVDGGTIELIRQYVPKIVSSGDLLQEFTSVWDEKKWQSHLFAASVLDGIAKGAWAWITEQVRQGNSIYEYDVQQWMVQAMSEKGCTTDHPPICAVNAHSADPHYAPLATLSSKIQKGDFILIDLWCKSKEKGAVYADITRIGAFAPTPKQLQIFQIVKKAQSSALAFVKERVLNKAPLHGYEVDRVCRNVIAEAGYQDFFLHRTGHNIDELDHGPGAHLDDFETHDLRLLLPGTCFSIEPGIYLKGEFGVRLEYDVFLHPGGEVIVTGGIQEEIELLA